MFIIEAAACRRRKCGAKRFAQQNLEIGRIDFGLFELDQGSPAGQRPAGASSSIKPDRVRGFICAIVMLLCLMIEAAARPDAVLAGRAGTEVSRT